MAKPGHISKEDYRTLLAPPAKAEKKPRWKQYEDIDYKSICALPTWKRVEADGVAAFWLPMPPSANEYWRVKNDKVFASGKAKAYKTEVGSLAHRLGMQPLDGPVCVYIRVYRKQAAGDLDNRLKVTLDALKGIAFHDDKQVEEIHAFQDLDRENPRIVICIVPSSDKLNSDPTLIRPKP